MNDRRQLLCTFSTTIVFKSVIEDLKRFYNVYSNRFFVFKNEKNDKDAFITYNIISEQQEFPKFPNTISIHRKKQTNTLYTLNAMNQIIRDENNGEFDRNFTVDWNLYKNSLIITGDVSIRVLPIIILDIIS
jgi:hypothetical protein